MDDEQDTFRIVVDGEDEVACPEVGDDDLHVDPIAVGGLDPDRGIVSDDGRVEHWLNGEKILEYELGSEETLKRVAATKFRAGSSWQRSLQV